MSSDGIAPDIVSFNTIIGAYAREGRIDDVNALYDALQRQQLKPDVFTFGTMINAYCKVSIKKQSQFGMRCC